VATLEALTFLAMALTAITGKGGAYYPRPSNNKNLKIIFKKADDMVSYMLCQALFLRASPCS